MMKRNLIRSTFCALVSGLMLAACGPVSEPPEVLGAPEALGTTEAALDCSGASVSTLVIQGASLYSGEFSAGGTWSVTYPSNAAYMEYFIDNNFKGSEYYLGDSNRSGSWSFNTSPVSCGSHTFKVVAYPAQYNSSTNAYGRCTTGSKTASKSFSEACPAICGNYICEAGETANNCVNDCCEASVCPDGKCCTTGVCSNGMACML